MKKILLGVVVCGVLLVSLAVADKARPWDNDVRLATSKDQAIAASAVERLRKHGPDALNDLLRRHELLAKQISKTTSAERDHLEQVIDKVGGQRHCSASRLFWYTDFEQAKAASRQSGRPILSLRLLGKLTDEYSCANSRFFRTTLYANQEISAYLRDHYVLHWKSVRPVPIVTIDFGDGRVLRRTLTGNSIHYVLAADGRPIDALPGLYSPAMFLAGLKRANGAAGTYASAKQADKESLLKQYHAQRRQAIAAFWTADLKKASPAKFEEACKQTAGPPAEPVTLNISCVDVPIPPFALDIQTLETITDEQIWKKIAALHRKNTRLDKSTVRLMRKENPTAVAAGEIAITKRKVEDPLLRVVRNLESSIALDTVRNEYLLHRQIHQWMAEGTAPTHVDRLNDRIYAKLFLTPGNDPWLGLVPPDTYTALQNGGVVRQPRK